MNLEAIFFDAGGTLVFPDERLTLAALHQRGFEPSQEQLYAAERAAKRQLDDARTASPASTPAIGSFITIPCSPALA